MENLETKLNKLWVGLIAGLIGPWFGMLIFYIVTYNHKTFSAFVQLIIHNSSTHSSIISVSLIFNLVFFYLALRQDWYYAVRGVIMATFIYAPFVIYFKYV